MPAHLRQLWERVRTSYWFVPTSMILAGIVLAWVAIEVDLRYDAVITGEEGWLREGDVAGTRALLSAVATTSVSVVSLVFSITLVTLSLTASQLGPSQLYTFMTDRANQAVLGSYLSTFVYCLLVLKASSGEYVLQVATTLGVVLALGTVCGLVYFIHNITLVIQAPHVILRIARQLDQAIERVFPADPPGRLDAPDDAPEPAPVPLTVCATRDGYVEALDPDGLLKLAAELEGTIELERRPGDFVVAGSPLAVLRLPAPTAEGDALVDRARRSILLGSRRTPLQDPAFPIAQLVEIAVRALSPGINDPHTAAQCVQRLSAALSRVAARPQPRRWLRDADGHPRVRRRVYTFDALLATSFDAIRRHAAGEVIVQTALLEALETLIGFCADDPRREAVREYAERLRASNARHVDDPADLERLAALHDRVVARLTPTGLAALCEVASSRADP